MRKGTTGLLIGAALVLALAGATQAGKQPWVENDRVEFRLHDLEGRIVDSSDPRFAGKVLLIDLWATWCPPCISEIPTLVDLQSRYGETGLTIIAIAFETEELAETRQQRLRSFVEESGINYLVLDGGLPEDFDKALPAVRDVRGFPVEILVDRAGTVVASRNGYGYKKKWARKLEREIDELLAAEAVD